MATDFQRQSRNRKILYAALILALFTVTLFYRPYLLEAHANSLALREQNRGEVDLTGAAVRLSLTGSRGLALCVLWNIALEKQARHEWNALEVHVRWITQLEPHFLTPWLFQSWNMAYNVSNESDRLRDKYFYISRGIELLAEGERQNRDHPDFRFNIGFYYMDKIGSADQQRTLRTLFQMSCIDPQRRNPDLMRTPDGKVDLDRFQAFCREQPFLVRRLREMQNCKTPEEVLDFLAENRDIPSRYEDVLPGTTSTGKSRLKPIDQQFPVLPPRRSDLQFTYDWTAETDPLPPDFDNFTAAQLWYTYAQEPLPPPGSIPVLGPAYINPDPTRYRLPRQPTTIIYRCYPALSQSHLAQRREVEGWFDRGWEIDAGQSGRNRWFADKVVVGEQNWAGQAWRKALALWKRNGTETGLLLDPVQLKRLETQANLYRQTFGVSSGAIDMKLRPEDFQGELRDSFEAHYQLWWYHKNREMTSFARLYAQAQAESTPDAIEARELFYEIRRKQRAAEPNEEILRLYEEALPRWKRVLHQFADFRADPAEQMFAYKQQTRYLALILEKRGPAFRHLLALQDALQQKNVDLKVLLLCQDWLAQGAGRLPGGAGWLPPGHLLVAGPLVEMPRGPFEEKAADGKPLINIEALRHARVDPEDTN